MITTPYAATTAPRWGAAASRLRATGTDAAMHGTRVPTATLTNSIPVPADVRVDGKQGRPPRGVPR